MDLLKDILEKIKYVIGGTIYKILDVASIDTFLILLFSVMLIFQGVAMERIIEANASNMERKNEEYIQMLQTEIFDLQKKVDGIIIKENNSKNTEELIPKDHSVMAETLLIEEDIDPILLFAVINARTKGDLFAAAPDSDLRGYGLMTEDTSRWVYEDMLGHTGYTHAMQTDGGISTEILAQYLSHLMKVHNGNIRDVCYSYIGSRNEGFYNMVVEYIEDRGTNVDVIEYKYMGDE